MATRALFILALAALAATGSSLCALAQSRSEQMVKTPATGAEPTAPKTNPDVLVSPATEIRRELSLLCRYELGSTQARCQIAPAPAAKPLVQPETVLATSLSLYTASNLATKETTSKFLQSIAGKSPAAQKAAPALMKIAKSLPARASLAVAVLGSGAMVVYERLPIGDAKAATNPSEGTLTYIFRGEIDRNGNEVTAAKKP